MKQTMKFANLAAMFLSVLAASALMVSADHGNGPARDALGGLKRAITQASAPALTAQQETDLKALITAYRDAQPDEADAALETARDVFDAAVLAGNLTAAQTAATQIATRQAELGSAHLRLLAKFEIDVLANLKTGGQLRLLVEKIGEDKVLGLVGSLAGQGGGRR